ncbi:MAG: hypothetical protein ACO3GP_02680 [Candidatus Limnocylindrus sp.]
MAVTVSIFDHTSQRFASGANASSDTYKVALYTAATYSAAATTLAGITKTEVASGNGYTTGGATLASVAVTTVTTNDAKFDANDVSWTVPAAGSLAAAYAILYNDTDTNDPPVLFIDFGETITTTDGGIFQIIWNASGIFTFTVT